MKPAGRLSIYVENPHGAPDFYVVRAEQVRAALNGYADATDIFVHTSDRPDMEALAQADFFIGLDFEPARLETGGQNLKIVHALTAGIERYLPLDWLPPGAVLTNSSGAHEEKGGQYGLMAVLMLNERIPRIRSNQDRATWEQIFSSSIRGKTAVFYGAGALARAVANNLRPLGVQCIGISRTGAEVEAFEACHPTEALHDHLPSADFLVVAAPLTDATRRAIGRKEISMLPAHAGLVNIGRAAVVDYAALRDALVSGTLSGAVLDVFDPEPLPPDSELWKTPGLIITPHVSCDDHQNYIERCLDIFGLNFVRSQHGLPLVNVVDHAFQY